MSYFESRLRINFENFDEIKVKLDFCEKLGIRNLILEPTNGLSIISTEIKREIEKRTAQKIFLRYNIKPKDLNDFKKKVNNFNKFNEILSVETSDKEIQVHAARDNRIDILTFSDQDIIKTISPGIISLIKQNNSFIEFSLSPIMIKNQASQSRNFRNLYRFIKLASSLKVLYIISGNFEDIYDFRNPRSLVSICHTLLGMPLIEAKKVFSENPKQLLKRAQNKRGNANFENGVKLIKGE